MHPLRTYNLERVGLQYDYDYGYCCLWLLCHSGNGIGHINESKLRRTRLVLRFVTFNRCTIPVFIQATQTHSAWLSLRG